jgi:hypothetical protein
MAIGHSLLGGEIIKQPRTGVPMHIDTAVTYYDPMDGTILAIKGHYPGTGTPMNTEQSAAAYVTEIYPEGSLVSYQGSLTAYHGTYRVTGPCTDDTCTEGIEDRYILTDDRTRIQLEHVRASSLAAYAAYCEYCATVAQTA